MFNSTRSKSVQGILQPINDKVEELRDFAVDRRKLIDELDYEIHVLEARRAGAASAALRADAAADKIEQAML